MRSRRKTAAESCAEEPRTSSIADIGGSAYGESLLDSPPLGACIGGNLKFSESLGGGSESELRSRILSERMSRESPSFGER